MNSHIEIPRDRLAAFCGRWRITELALFGSIMRADFGPDSDVDVLARFDEQARHTLFDLVHMEDELRLIFGREIDLVSRRAIEASRNPMRRKAILESTEVIYAA
uniref:Polymerase nucleotidyl transferase domain-containing protein n=1 Tax=Candidatus Kentrum sp. DK TaxID=2126562 RepID=A0A450RTV2_9GAMM|nr:MAG: hypothetical protein BECKDK2373C_GA0170839_100111 [Candidatus Kentron sp. DK]